MTEQEYVDKAVAYLEPLKSIEEESTCKRLELQQLRKDIITLGAVDYAKERLTGGGIPSGVDNAVVMVLEAEQRCEERLNQLVEQRENARLYIVKIKNVKGKILLTREYLHNMSFKEATAAFKNQKEKQLSRLKRKALVELAMMLP